MHTYDTPPPRRPAFASVPSARSAQDGVGAGSATPIYDMLYAEWVKTFRTLPGDRSGEEGLRFSPFGELPGVTGVYGGHRAGSFSSSYSAYSAGAYSARQQSQWQRIGTLGRQHDTGMLHVPAALPPGPRQGL
ncbi:hypothetical protein GQF42_11555 [Streptomyces broussonetiae]|uniref:Uncharacterized protein n=1 Tax=Streptomyces broussonetiae TaxID=2686304 RepID=A0A6I6N577_9ACTN|nr:hypothetical protein [Streptomyces broussonetiae]QHA03827.1 hypothetical protein GQF42_11555 [Streptomyces broussonetiae]